MTGRPELLVTIDSPNGTPIAKVSRKNALHVFETIISLPDLWSGLENTESSNSIKIYRIRQDLGPIVAAYVLVNRNSPRPEKWDFFLREMLNGSLSLAGRNISAIIELIFILSKLKNKEVSSNAMDVVANMLRVLAEGVAIMMKNKKVP